MVEVIHFRHARAIRFDVSHVAFVPFTRVRSAVRLIGGIEMSAGRARIRGAAIAKLVDVKTVLAGCKAGDFAFHTYAIGHFSKRDRAVHVGALRRVQYRDRSQGRGRSFRGLCRRGLDRYQPAHRREEKNERFHIIICGTSRSLLDFFIESTSLCLWEGNDNACTLAISVLDRAMQCDHLLIATALDALHGSGGGVTGRAFLFPCSEMEVSIFEFDVHIAEVAIGQGKALSVEEPAESWLSYRA